MGYGLLQICGDEPSMVAMGILDLKKLKDPNLKLRRISERVSGLIDEFLPDELAIEEPFYGKNPQSMLKLGRAQGVAMAAGLLRDMPIFQYSPRKIKMSITGNGNASKEQVAGMLKNILHLKQLPKNLDATDGLAAALCHHYQAKVPQTGGSYSNWGDFIRKNPGRVK
jgi:crossover junction endodeoxyribonuclease RuvC